MTIKKKTILFLSWRDIKSLKKGGAEVYTHEMMARADHTRFNFIHFSPEFEGCLKDEVIDGVRYIRDGKNEIDVIHKARKYYKKNQEAIDFVVDQCNTHRFFTKFWVEKNKRIFFIHQFTREIWYIHAKQPLASIGFHSEIPFLKLSKDDYTITVSDSTRNELIKVGFDPEKTVILPEGIDFKHWDRSEFLEKEEDVTFIYVGRFAKYKGIDDTIEAFSILKRKYPKAKLWIVGKKNEDYIKNDLGPIMTRGALTWGNPEENCDVTFYGFVSEQMKLELMSKAKALVFPSLREGWGLIVTEAAAVGTPSIGYNSAGIVDALKNGEAGYLCSENNVNAIVKNMINIIEDEKAYDEMREKAYLYSLNFHWDNTGAEFNKFMDKVIENTK